MAHSAIIGPNAVWKNPKPQVQIIIPTVEVQKPITIVNKPEIKRVNIEHVQKYVICATQFQNFVTIVMRCANARSL